MMSIRNAGSNGTGCVLKMETNHEKMMIVISVIIQNPPPPKQRLLLLREHKWKEELHTVNHFLYSPPPSVRYNTSSYLTNNNSSSSSSKENCQEQLSRLAIVMGLLSLYVMHYKLTKWVNAIFMVAPSLQLLVLHNTDQLTHHSIASGDIVIITSLLFHDIQL
jgi:hypothetical protein